MSGNKDNMDRFEERFNNLEEMVSAIYKFFFVGNSKPAFLLQVDRNTTFRKVASWVLGVIFVASVAGVVGMFFHGNQYQ